MGKHKKHHRERSDDEDDHDRRAHKSAKKAAKVAKALGYSNEINPFGDSNLLQPFVWGKRQEKKAEKVRSGGGGGGDSDDEETKRIKLMQEIDRVRKRRETREAELEEMERLRGEEQRLREAASYGDWQSKEEDFHRQQTKVRSKIRLLDRRERPIDLLAKNMLLIEAEETAAAAEAGLSNCNGNTSGVIVKALVDEKERDVAAALAYLETADVTDPVVMVAHLSLPDLQQLAEDVDSYLELEEQKEGGKGGPHVEFWAALASIVSSQLKHLKASKTSSSSSSSSSSSRSGGEMHRAVREDVERLLQGKSADELRLLQGDILRNVRAGHEDYGDTDYWEAIAAEVGVGRCKMVVRKHFDELLERKRDLIATIKTRIRGERAQEREQSNSSGGGSSKDLVKQSQRALGAIAVDGHDEVEDQFTADERALLRGDGEDAESSTMKDVGMGADDEVALKTIHYSWKDKYLPRKPRYLNKVRTGYVWNQYNRTHYTSDNPPPKMVQGYKFTIFYPDLIDKSITPKYKLLAADEPQFAIIRFTAGPPYEDIAFKIVNNEWNVDKRAGFRITFERGVLQLHFSFKHHIYKR